MVPLKHRLLLAAVTLMRRSFGSGWIRKVYGRILLITADLLHQHPRAATNIDGRLFPECLLTPRAATGRSIFRR